MTQDEIILMADASGLSYYGMGKDREKFLHYLGAFANLVAAAEREAITALREALAQPEQEPVAWNVIDPAGNILATEKNAIRGWARVNGYKPTVEGLLGLHELGWRVLPTSPPAAQPEQEPVPEKEWVYGTPLLDAMTQDYVPAQRPWQGLTIEEINKIMDDEIGFNSCWGPEESFARAVEAKLKERNT